MTEHSLQTRSRATASHRVIEWAARCVLSTLMASALCLAPAAQAQVKESKFAKTLKTPQTAPRPSQATPPVATPAPPVEPPSAAGVGAAGDYIVVLVNNELITAIELANRLALVKRNAQLSGTGLPPKAELKQQVLDAMIDERVLVTHAREVGQRVDDAELDRLIANQAQQNQLTSVELKEQLRAEGIDFNTYRNNLRDQLLIDRVREREIQARVRITDAELESFMAQRLQESGLSMEYNIAQVLIRVPEGASEAQVAQKRALADTALQRLRSGEPMDSVAKALSEDDNKDKGGALGLRNADRLPDVFIEQVRDLKAGEPAPAVLRTGAGFHVLQLIEKRNATSVPMVQTRARHILLRPSKELSRDAALRQLAEFKKQIQTGRRSFEQLAREHSQDGSAPQGGDLGWTMQGSFVPEFEAVMNALQVGELSDPTVSRFGVHLIQVTDRKKVPVEIKQLREVARNALRQQKSEAALTEWLKDLRSRAYIEYREVPQ